jgi:cold shock CspA family protein
MTDDYRDVFLHISNWFEIDGPQKGERVTYVEETGNRGPRARQVMRAFIRPSPK